MDSGSRSSHGRMEGSGSSLEVNASVEGKENYSERVSKSERETAGEGLAHRDSEERLSGRERGIELTRATRPAHREVALTHSVGMAVDRDRERERERERTARTSRVAECSTPNGFRDLVYSRGMQAAQVLQPAQANVSATLASNQPVHTTHSESRPFNTAAVRARVVARHAAAATSSNTATAAVVQGTTQALSGPLDSKMNARKPTQSKEEIQAFMKMQIKQRQIKMMAEQALLDKKNKETKRRLDELNSFRKQQGERQMKKLMIEAQYNASSSLADTDDPQSKYLREADLLNLSIPPEKNLFHELSHNAENPQDSSVLPFQSSSTSILAPDVAKRTYPVSDSIQRHMLEIDRILMESGVPLQSTPSSHYPIPTTDEIPISGTSSSSQNHENHGVRNQQQPSQKLRQHLETEITRTKVSMFARSDTQFSSANAPLMSGVSSMSSSTNNSNGRNNAAIHALSPAAISAPSSEQNRVILQSIIRQSLEISERVKRNPQLLSASRNAPQNSMKEKQDLQYDKQRQKVLAMMLQRNNDSRDGLMVDSSNRECNDTSFESDAIGNDGFFSKSQNRSGSRSPGIDEKRDTAAFQQLVNRYAMEERKLNVAGSMSPQRSDQSFGGRYAPNAYNLAGNNGFMGGRSSSSSSTSSSLMGSPMAYRSRRDSFEWGRVGGGLGGLKLEQERSLSRAKRIMEGEDERRKKQLAARVIQKFVRRYVGTKRNKRRQKQAQFERKKAWEHEEKDEQRWLDREQKDERDGLDSSLRMEVDSYRVFDVLERVRPGFGDAVVPPPSSSIPTGTARASAAKRVVPPPPQAFAHSKDSASSSTAPSKLIVDTALSDSTSAIKAVDEEHEVIDRMDQSGDPDDSVSYSATFEDEPKPDAAALAYSSDVTAESEGFGKIDATPIPSTAESSSKSQLPLKGQSYPKLNSNPQGSGFPQSSMSDSSFENEPLDFESDSESGRFPPMSQPRLRPNDANSRTHHDHRLRLDAEIKIGGRLSPRSLSRKFETELRHLESLHTADEQVSELHRLQLLSTAQQDAFAFTHLLQQKEHVIDKHKADLEQAKRERELAELRLRDPLRNVNKQTLFPSTSISTIGDHTLSHMSGLQFTQSSPNVPPTASAAEDYGQEEFASISDYAPAVKVARSSYGSEKSKRSHSNEVSEELEVASYLLGQTPRRDDASEFISSYRGSRSDHESPTPLSLYDAQLSQISSQFGFGRHGRDESSAEDSLMNLDESSINIEALTSLETNRVRDTLMDYTFALDEREKTASEHMKSELRAAKLNAKAQVVISRDSEERRRIADEYKKLESSLRVKLAVEKVEIKRLRSKALELIKQHEGANIRDTSPIRRSTDPPIIAVPEKPVTTRLKDSQRHVKPLPSVSSLFLSVPEDLGTGASHASISENIEFVNDDLDLRSVVSEPVSIVLPYDNSEHSRNLSQSPATQPSTPKASTSLASASASTVTSIVQKLQQLSAHVADVAKLERKKERLEKSQAVGERLLNDSLKKIKLEEDVFILETRLQSILQQCSELAKKEDVLKKKKKAAVVAAAALASNRASPTDLARELGDRTPTMSFRKAKNQSIHKAANVSPDAGDEIDEDLNYGEISVHDSIPIDIQTDLASRQESIRSLADSILYEVDIVREKVGSSGFDKSIPELVESIQSDIKSVVEDISSYGGSFSSGSGASKQSVSFAKEVVVADSTSAAYDYESDAFEAPVEVATKVIDVMDEDDDSESDANDEDVEHLKNLQRELEERQAKIKDLLVRKKEAKKVAKAEQARLKKEAIQFEIQQLDAVIRKTEEDIEKTIAPISKTASSPSTKKSSLVSPARLVENDQSKPSTSSPHLKSPLMPKSLRNDEISSYGSIAAPITHKSPPSSDDISSFAGKSNSHGSSHGKSSARVDRAHSSKQATEFIPNEPASSSAPPSVDEILSYQESTSRSLSSKHSRALSGGVAAVSKQASVVDDISSYGDSTSRSVDAIQSPLNHIAAAEEVTNDIASQEYEEDFSSADDIKNDSLPENATSNEVPQMIARDVAKADMDSTSDIAEDIEYDDHDFIEEDDDLESNSRSKAVISPLAEKGIALSTELSPDKLPESTEARNVKPPVVIETKAASVVDEDLDYADDYANEDEESEVVTREREQTDLENSGGSRNIKSERSADSGHEFADDEVVPSTHSQVHEVGNVELANVTNLEPTVISDEVEEDIEEELSLHSSKGSASPESMSGKLDEKSISVVNDLDAAGNTDVDDYSIEDNKSLHKTSHETVAGNDTSSRSDHQSDRRNRTVSESTASEDDESELHKVEEQHLESVEDSSVVLPTTSAAKAVPILQHSLYTDHVTELLLDDALRDSIEAVTMIQKPIVERTPSPSLSESSSSSSPHLASISQPPELPEIDIAAERSRRADEITNLLWMDMMNEFAVEQAAILSRKETPVTPIEGGSEEMLEGEFASASLEALIQARNVPFTAMEVSEEEAKQLDALIAAKTAADVVEISASYDAPDRSIIEPEPTTPNIADTVMRIKRDTHYMSSSFGSQFAHAVVSEFAAPENPQGYERMPQIPVDVKQALVGFPMDPVIRARYRLLLDLIREALEEVFDHHENFASDEPRRATRSFIMLMPPRPISKQDTATRVAAKVGAWNAYTEVHGGNLDQMLMDSVKADEPDWLDMSIDRDIVVNQVADGLFGDVSKDALSILSK
ncbi:hypothetical protein BJ741DRAFT_416202 [Chytriomyces cf. hyalinus JEL632]|nr:hypothetical protein BJ741DRAFT_416202 [Chytriomyces cf. hyalinus JEL632]